jgi:hypothetical protein
MLLRYPQPELPFYINEQLIDKQTGFIFFLYLLLDLITSVYNGVDHGRQNMTLFQ